MPAPYFSPLKWAIILMVSAIFLAGCGTAPSEKKEVTPVVQELGKSAPSRDEARYTTRQYPDDSRPEGLLGHAEAMNRPNIIFIDNRAPMFRTFKKAYYRVDSRTDKLSIMSILVQMQESWTKFDTELRRTGDDKESVKRGMMMMNAWGEETRKLVGELHAILGD